MLRSLHRVGESIISHAFLFCHNKINLPLGVCGDNVLQ